VALKKQTVFVWDKEHMADQDIEIKIGPDGTIDIDMIGFKGTACSIELQKLVKNIGVVVSNKKKQDYYEDDKKVQITE
jgi:hypothetical protein